MFFKNDADVPTAYLATAIAIIAILIYVTVYSGPLGSIPGPLIARVSPLWLVYHSKAGDMHRATIELHKRYGPVVLTGPREISVIDVEAVRKIYAVNSGFRKSDWYSVWQGKRKFDLFPERNEKLHASQRRHVNRVYSMEALKEGEQYVDSAISVYLNKLDELAGKPIDMALWNQFFAFDVIGEVTFSQRFGFIEKGTDEGTFENIDKVLHSAAWLGQVPFLFRLDAWFTPFIGSHVGTTARHGTIREFSAKHVEARMSRGSDRNDILGKLKSVHEAKPEDFDQAAVLSMATTNVNAGSDTTAVSLNSVMYHLCKYPAVKAKLMEEILDREKQGLIGASITTDVALKMPFLQACIQEALRLHPAVGMSLPRVAPEQGFTIGENYIPGGTVVGTNAWVIHRNKDIYGQDAEVFRPERWLEGDKSDIERYFLSFGAGSRTCLGRHLSWMEMSKVIPLLLLRFDMELADRNADWTEDCHWFVKQKGFTVILKPRQAR